MADDIGTTSLSERIGQALIGLGLLAVLALVISVATSTPVDRRYPDREPVYFWHMWTGEWKDEVDKIVDAFNKSQETYEVVALSIPAAGGAMSKFLLGVAGGDPPDVMAQWDSVIPNWAEAGLLQPLDGLMSPQKWEELRREMYPAARRIGMYKDRLYGVTIGLNIWACYYRPDHLREVGLDPDAFPQTLEELSEWGRKLNRFDDRGNLIRMGFLPGNWIHMALAAGGRFYDWEKDVLYLNTPDNVRSLRWLYEERARLGFDNVVRFRAGLNEGGYAQAWGFMSGAYSICVDGQWRVEQIRKYRPDLEYRTAPIPPRAEGGRKLASWSNGNFMIIPRGAKNVPGAWEFVKFWSGIEHPERAAEFYTMGGWLPITPAVAEAPFYQKYLRDNPQFRTFLEVLASENVEPTPPVPYQVMLLDSINRADDRTMRGAVTPEEALARLQAEVEQEIARRRELGYAD